MKVRVRLVGFPDVERRLGAKGAEVEFPGRSATEFLGWLQRTYGDPAGVKVVDACGRPDPDVVALRNGWQRLDRDDPSIELKEGDEITLLLVMAGG
ncbi:MAG: hypothetical protein Kow0092_28340 [Deferrisomatales bacterium]